MIFTKGSAFAFPLFFQSPLFSTVGLGLLFSVTLALYFHKRPIGNIGKVFGRCSEGVRGISKVLKFHLFFHSISFFYLYKNFDAIALQHEQGKRIKISCPPPYG